MLIDMGRFYGYDLDKRRLELYAQVLGQFPEQLVLQSGREYVQNPKNDRFPVPPHKIMAKYLPAEISPEAQAREIAARIVGGVTKFGWANSREAKAHIGPTGWRVVELQGGWQSICENLGVGLDPGVFQAQLREQLKARLEYGEENMEAAVQLDSKRESAGLIPMKDVLSLLTSNKGGESGEENKS
jgi:hypothetical protein